VIPLDWPLSLGLEVLGLSGTHTELKPSNHRSMRRMITLLTDFGTRDVYVGVMKGAISTICPEAQIIDLTHAIPPQDVYAARFNLLNAVPYFPPATIHVVVVDPGVGTMRRGITVQTKRGILVGPDNGVLSGVFDGYDIEQSVALTNRDYWRVANPSTTFHGRDIFAPVAAHLACGVPLARLGQAISPAALKRLELPPVVETGQRLQGTIQYIDHFGNCVTTMAASQVGDGAWQVAWGGVRLPKHNTYGDVEVGQPLALIGSHGWVEIAVNQGSAQQQLSLQVGTKVTLSRVAP
jgi:S-adenosylmethionine hydrolase